MLWLLRGEFLFSIIKVPIYLISNLINLSASNDVSMYFQEHIEERYSSNPEV